MDADEHRSEGIVERKEITSEVNRSPRRNLRLSVSICGFNCSFLDEANSTFAARVALLRRGAASSTRGACVPRKMEQNYGLGFFPVIFEAFTH
jgi:hypothetical protein